MFKLCVSAQTRTEKDSYVDDWSATQTFSQQRTIAPLPNLMASKGEDGGRYLDPVVVAADSFTPRFVQAYPWGHNMTNLLAN